MDNLYFWRTPGYNPNPTPTVDITLTVNTSNITVDATGIFLAGGGVFGNPPGDNPLTQDANNPDLWSITVTKSQGFANHYIFTNGNSGWGAKENLSGLPCGDPQSYDDRFMGPILSDTTIQHCFGTCVFDGTCP